MLKTGAKTAFLAKKYWGEYILKPSIDGENNAKSPYTPPKCIKIQKKSRKFSRLFSYLLLT